MTHRSNPSLARTAAACGMVVLLAGPASAQSLFDQMKCYKIRDSQPGKQYTADLAPS